MPDAVAHGCHLLLPHPVAEPEAVRKLVEELRVDVSSRHDEAGAGLRVVFRLRGDIPRIKLPDARQPLRTDGLWRHTCFEVFVARTDSSHYWEFNFSPSGAWAAYHFSGYREGMAPLLVGTAPITRRRESADGFELDAGIDLSWLVLDGRTVQLQLGLAAVVEDKAGSLSYWALRHPGEKPDFHHRDGFVLRIEPAAAFKLEPNP
jgi:hypothetical protein